MDRSQFQNNLESILTRSQDIDTILEQLLNHWKFDLFSRSPHRGADSIIDLDLACFMAALVDRGAVINIPAYKSARGRTRREGEHVVSAGNRHGKMMGLVSNKDVFSFSVRIDDANVMTTDSVGAPRNFMIVGLDGEWYDGWKTIEFLPSAKENNFLDAADAWDGYVDGRITFKHFVHPNRWTSFYGRHYFLSKTMIVRLTEYAKFCKNEVERLLSVGVTFPLGEKSAPKEWPKSTRDATVAKTFTAFEAEVETPPVDGEFASFDETQEDLVRASRERRRMEGALAQLRFATRATELAYYRHGLGNKVPVWIEGSWTENYREAGKRKNWNRLLPFEDSSIALRWRAWDKSERVAP